MSGYTNNKDQTHRESLPKKIAQDYKNHASQGLAKELYWLQMDFQIQNKIACELMTHKSIDFVTNQDDDVNYPNKLLYSLELPRLQSHNLQQTVGSA